MIDYPKLSTEDSEGKKAAVKPPKAGKPAATKSATSPEGQQRPARKIQVSPEEQKRREALREKTLANQEARAELQSKSLEQRRAKLEAKGKLMLPPELKVKTVLPTAPPPPPNDVIPHIKGKATKLLTEDLEPVDAYYALIDLRHAQPSHLIDVNSRITPNSVYPKMAQPRDYGWNSNNHRKVLRHVTQKYDPHYTTDDPGPTGGPSSITPRGFAHNGNGRLIEQLYSAALDQSDPGKGHYDWLANAYEREAAKFGINPADVKKIRDEGGYPSIVRITPGVQEGTDEFETLARAGNKSTTEVEDPVLEAASNAKLVFKAEDPEQQMAQLADLFKKETDLASVLQKPNHPLVRMIRDIVSTKPSYASYFDKKERLHGEGRNRVENMLLSVVIPDFNLLQTADYQAKAFKNVIGDALPSIIRSGKDIIEPLERAMRFVVENPDVRTYANFRNAYNQGALEFPDGTTKTDPVTLELLDAMYRTKVKGRWSAAGMQSVFRNVAGEIAQHRLQKEGKGLFKKATATPEEQAKQLESGLVSAIRDGASEDAIARTMSHAAAHQQEQQQEGGEQAAVAQDEGLADEEGNEEKSPQSATPVVAPAATKSQPSSRQKSFLDQMSQRHHHDATRDLYTAVHAAYYHKVTSPPQRVARKNSAPKRSKVH